MFLGLFEKTSSIESDNLPSMNCCPSIRVRRSGSDSSYDILSYKNFNYNGCPVYSGSKMSLNLDRYGWELSSVGYAVR